MPKTASEILALKDSWRENPHWDIEDTEGFEDHHQELLGFRIEQESIWEALRARRYVNLNKPRTAGDCRQMTADCREEIHDAGNTAREDRALACTLAAGFENLLLIGGEIAAQLAELNQNLKAMRGSTPAPTISISVPAGTTLTPTGGTVEG